MYLELYAAGPRYIFNVGQTSMRFRTVRVGGWTLGMLRGCWLLLVVMHTRASGGAMARYWPGIVYTATHSHVTCHAGPWSRDHCHAGSRQISAICN